MTLVRIGYWRSDDHPEWPAAEEFIDPAWNAEERYVTALYLSSGTIARTYMGVRDVSPVRRGQRIDGVQ